MSTHSQAAHDPQRVLILMTADDVDQETSDELAAHCSGAADVKCVASIPAGRLRTFSQDDRHGRPIAEQRLEHVRNALMLHGISARTVVGDFDPVQSVIDGTATFTPDEMVLVMHPRAQEDYREHQLEARLRGRVSVPITVLRVEHEPLHIR